MHCAHQNLVNCITSALPLHPFNGLFSRASWVNRDQKGKTGQDLNEARDDRVPGWQWHQLDHTQTICNSLHTDNHTNTSSLSDYYMVFILYYVVPVKIYLPIYRVAW